MSEQQTLKGRKLGDRRVVVDRPHARYFRYLGPGVLEAKLEAQAPRTAQQRRMATLRAILSGAGQVNYKYVRGLSVVVVALLVIVTFSYRQTIRAYPNGGGSYIVAHANLGVLAGLVAAGSLLTDYVLTVSVSVSAGIQAIYSAIPALQPIA